MSENCVLQLSRTVKKITGIIYFTQIHINRSNLESPPSVLAIKRYKTYLFRLECAFNVCTDTGKLNARFQRQIQTS